MIKGEARELGGIRVGVSESRVMEVEEPDEFVGSEVESESASWVRSRAEGELILGG